MNTFIGFIIIVCLSLIMYQTNTLAKETVDLFFRKKLRKNIISALKGNHDTKEDIDIISKSLNFNSRNAHKECLKIQSMIIRGDLPDLELKKDHLGKIISDYEKNQPFDELPPDIKYYLINIKNNYNGSGYDIDMLNINIKAIIDENNNETKKQKYVNYISLSFGVVSFAFAIYSQFSQ